MHLHACIARLGIARYVPGSASGFAKSLRWRLGLRPMRKFRIRIILYYNTWCSLLNVLVIYAIIMIITIIIITIITTDIQGCTQSAGLEPGCHTKWTPHAPIAPPPPSQTLKVDLVLGNISVQNNTSLSQTTPSPRMGAWRGKLVCSQKTHHFHRHIYIYICIYIYIHRERDV